MDTFDLYFASVVSFQYHPANPAHARMSLEDCMWVAFRMLDTRARAQRLRPELFKEEV